ncbi:MAG: ABC transporter substrate-binding protein [Anaerolineales bacterium]|nr:ABC transporter substrate-binding protein [Anaerolineales bacterium]
MKKIFILVICLLFISACTSTPSMSPQEITDPNVQAPKSESVTSVEQAPEGAEAPAGYKGKTWGDILAEAKGQTVNFYMWGGSDTTNTWVSGYVAEHIKDSYGVTLNMVPVADIVDTVNKVLGEKQAGKESGGSVDLIWINGENFRSMHKANLLYGAWSQFLPNTRYVNWDDASVAYDFGYPVEGYESPYGKAQFVMVYDRAKIETPPASISELFAWAKENPGKFTYPAPPDFTGSVFVRHVCYSATGGYEQFLGEYNETLFNDKFSSCWDSLNEIAPALWREGQTYPENRTRMQDLFANGEVYFDMTYSPTEASNLIAQGKYPETARTFIFDEGTIANTHYLAITFNSDHKAGAMVVANFVLSPEAQYHKALPENWGDLTALDPQKLPAEWQEKFSGIARGEATLDDSTLAAHRLPELQADWLVAIEEGWEDYVLNGK